MTFVYRSVNEDLLKAAKCYECILGHSITGKCNIFHYTASRSCPLIHRHPLIHTLCQFVSENCQTTNKPLKIIIKSYINWDHKVRPFWSCKFTFRYSRMIGQARLQDIRLRPNHQWFGPIGGLTAATWAWPTARSNSLFGNKNGDRQTVHPITPNQVPAPFPNGFQWRLPRWFCETERNHLASHVTRNHHLLQKHRLHSAGWHARPKRV